MADPQEKAMVYRPFFDKSHFLTKVSIKTTKNIFSQLKNIIQFIWIEINENLKKKIIMNDIYILYYNDIYILYYNNLCILYYNNLYIFYNIYIDR